MDCRSTNESEPRPTPLLKWLSQHPVRPEVILVADDIPANGPASQGNAHRCQPQGVAALVRQISAQLSKPRVISKPDADPGRPAALLCTRLRHVAAAWAQGFGVGWEIQTARTTGEAIATLETGGHRVKLVIIGPYATNPDTASQEAYPPDDLLAWLREHNHPAIRFVATHAFDPVFGIPELVDRWLRQRLPEVTA